MPHRHGSFSRAGARLIAYLGLLALALGRPNHLFTYLLVPVYAFRLDENTKLGLFFAILSALKSNGHSRENKDVIRTALVTPCGI